MPDCIFCKIALGEIPATKIYEDEEFLAFLDIKPVQPGHTLVIPKKHYDNLLTTPREVVGRLYQVVHKLAPAVVTGAAAAGFNLGLNNGSVAGQIVYHTHVHIIPRTAQDGLELWGQTDYLPGQMSKVAEQIKSALNIVDLRN